VGRTAGDPELSAPAVEKAVHEINAKLPVFDVRSLEESARTGNMFELIESTFASVFAVLALILAGSGIYGVMAYRTQLRTHEIGIRVALGASRTDVLRMILLQGLRMTAIGLVRGLGISLLLTRILHGLLFGVSATDPLTILSVTGVLLLVGIAATYVPALKAMHTDPVTAIRQH
jgi:ABC-type antimicrobial peptide transport system permease subunit